MGAVKQLETEFIRKYITMVIYLLGMVLTIDTLKGRYEDMSTNDIRDHFGH
jgi:hypothetical protein